jgi:hypothetical protein
MLFIVRFSLKTKCEALSSTSGTCSKMGLIGDICSSKYGESMKSMKGCKYYNTICNSSIFAFCKCPGSYPTNQPSECETFLSVSLLPTLTAQQKVRNICNAVNKAHDSCGKCTRFGDPETSVSAPCSGDPLDVLSDLCTTYNNNSNCAEWRTWCASNSGAVMDSFCKRTDLMVKSFAAKSAVTGRAGWNLMLTSALTIALSSSFKFWAI